MACEALLFERFVLAHFKVTVTEVVVSILLKEVKAKDLHMSYETTLDNDFECCLITSFDVFSAR